MVDEEPAKRVVKRVVKKTVVRPGAPSEAAPKLRYGRPVATTPPPRAKVASRTSTKPAPSTRPPARTRPPRQQIDVRAKARAAQERLGRAWWFVADGARSGARTAGGFTATRARAVAAWRLPHLNAYLAATVTGAVVGLVCVALGVIALAIFQDVRGVSSGGGLWGGLTFTALAVVAVLLGESLLRGFGSGSARLTSILAVVLSIIALLGLFLGIADTWIGIVLVPLLGAATFVVAHWLIDLAEHTPPVVE